MSTGSRSGAGLSLAAALIWCLAGLAAGTPATAQTRAAQPAGAATAPPAAICLVIDEARDNLSVADRFATLLLARREFASVGWRVVEDGCLETYTVSHVRLGSAIFVHLAGPRGERQARAAGLDDLPALYNQMARSLATGKPFGSLAIIDRTNVTETQTSPPHRVEAESFNYARVGYGGVYSGSMHGTGSFGFGYRAEFDTLGLDVSYLNYQLASGGGAYGDATQVRGLSLVRVAALRSSTARDRRAGMRAAD